MALDPSIILQAGRGVTPLMSPAEIQDAQMQRELGGYKLAQLRQGMQDDAAYRQVLQGGGQDLPNRLYQAGLGKQAQEAQKFQTDQQKAQGEAGKLKIETALKNLDAMGQIMGGVSDQASYDAARQHAAKLFGPEAAANIPPIYNPAEVAQRMQQAMSVKDRLAQQLQAQGQQITMRGQDLTQGTTLRGQDLSRDTALQGQAITMRGQDMTSARAAESNLNGRVPSGYRQAADGTLEFIPGGPADPSSKPAGGKPLNEGQSKALLFGTRMQEANDILEGKASKGVDQPGLIKRGAEAIGMGGAANWTQSSDQQVVEQAQRDFINATLRRESGAAIADSEFVNAKKQYFPQVNDDKEVIANKKRNREVAQRGILAEVPDAEARVAQVRGAPKSDSKAPQKIADKAAFDALPPGAVFIAPDGSKRRKP